MKKLLIRLWCWEPEEAIPLWEAQPQASKGHKAPQVSESSMKYKIHMIKESPIENCAYVNKHLECLDLMEKVNDSAANLYSRGHLNGSEN